MMVGAALDTGWRLSELLEGLAAVPRERDALVYGVHLDSRRVVPGGLFLACRGASVHGLAFLGQVLERGALAVAYEPDPEWSQERIRALPSSGVPLVPIPDLRLHAGEIAARFYGDPSQDLEVIGITGTNGKTSCSQFVAQALMPDIPCAVVGTLGSGFPGGLLDGTHTTPDPVTLQARLAELRDEGAKAVAMEVSSHALDQGRVNAVRFDLAVLTNLSRDHLDYHGGMQDYAAAKQRLFHHPGLRAAVLNHDDPFGRELLADLQPEIEALVYGTGPAVPLPDNLAGWVWGDGLRVDADGIGFDVRSSWGGGHLRSRLLGRFNVNNLLAVLTVLLHRGFPLSQALERLAELPGVPGRMERFGGSGRPTVVVDYAHTPDALEKALQTLAEHCRGRLICVFGCGGDRDRGKRPLMGAVAERWADRVLLTDDNPRGEDGHAIIAEIRGGMTESGAVDVVRNRRLAIRRALAEARVDDLVLVAGKGHETTQLSGTLAVHFSDREEVPAALEQWGDGE